MVQISRTKQKKKKVKLCGSIPSVVVLSFILMLAFFCLSSTARNEDDEEADSLQKLIERREGDDKQAVSSLNALPSAVKVPEYDDTYVGYGNKTTIITNNENHKSSLQTSPTRVESKEGVEREQGSTIRTQKQKQLEARQKQPQSKPAASGPPSRQASGASSKTTQVSTTGKGEININGNNNNDNRTVSELAPPKHPNFKDRNRGIWDGKFWRVDPNRHVHNMFMERLDRLLPDCPPDNRTRIVTKRQQKGGGSITVRLLQKPCDDHIRLFINDIERIERELLQFDIPKPIVVHHESEAPFIPIQFWRWKKLQQHKQQRQYTNLQCANCHIRHASFDDWLPPMDTEKEPAHVRFRKGCRRDITTPGYRQHADQILVGGCQESQKSTGLLFYNQRTHYGGGIEDVEYHMGFTGGGPFLTTFPMLHFGPTHHPVIPELTSVTDFARQLFRYPPTPRQGPENNNSTEDASFSHLNCVNPRAAVVKGMENHSNMTVAYYGKCHHSKDSGLHDSDRSGCYHKKPSEQEEKHLFHTGSNCDAHRDAAKTIISSWHPFTFSLENTVSVDYFTEKRFQALLGGSVPVVYDNHNSLDFLPDPDAAMIVDWRITKEKEDRQGYNSSFFVSEVARVGELIHEMAQERNHKRYRSEYMAWKQRGLRPSFVRKLFLSMDFVTCRICEYMAHYHFYDDDNGEKHERDVGQMD